MRCRIGFEMVERFKNDPNIGDALGDSARQRQKTQYIRAMPYKKSCYFEALHPSQTLPNHSKSLPEHPPRAPKSSKKHLNDPRDTQQWPRDAQEVPERFPRLPKRRPRDPNRVQNRFCLHLGCPRRPTRRQKTQHSRAMPYKKNCYFEALHPYQTLPKHSKSLPEQPPRAPKSSKRHPNDPRDAQETPNSGQETPKKCLRGAQECPRGAQETPIASKIDFART